MTPGGLLTAAIALTGVTVIFQGTPVWGVCAGAAGAAWVAAAVAGARWLRAERDKRNPWTPEDEAILRGQRSLL